MISIFQKTTSGRLVRFPVSHRLAVAVLVFLSAAFQVHAQTVLPLEILQDQTKYNYQSVLGVTNVPGPPPPTAGQFSSFISYGAVAGPGNEPANDPGQDLIVMKRVSVGAPYLGRSISYPFGSEIAAPLVDFNGEILPENAGGINFWSPEPFTTNLHTFADYYWSPHAGQVYAVQPGPINITWVQRDPYPVGSEPSGYVNVLGAPLGIPSFVTNSANVYLLMTQSYLVSGSPVKKPRKIYWTEKSFRRIGKPIRIPTARVGAVNIVHNRTTFPRTVDEEYFNIGDTSPSEGSTNQPLQELRTLWYDQQLESIFAYNIQGRVFVEFLGDLTPDNVTRQQIGFEIVDVFKQPTPSDLVVELGERIPPPAPDTFADVVPEPLLQVGGDTFDYQHNVEGSARIELYAAKETENANDYIVYWMENGVAGILWPRHFSRYSLYWPRDVGRYSHYIRPEALTDEEAMLTAVPLRPESVPFIQYQDPLDEPRAKITAESMFFTRLDSTQPAHRTLLRYTVGDYVGFERVFSWLDTELPNVVAYESAYTNYLAASTRGVNGQWRLYVTDDYSRIDGGSIGSWSMDVITRNPVTREETLSTYKSVGGLLLLNDVGCTNDCLNVSAPYPSVIEVSDIVDPVLKIRARLNKVTHSWPNDIDVYLMGPNGTTACILMSDSGSSVDIVDQTLIFDDDAGSEVSETAAYSGLYRPTDRTDNSSYVTNDIPPPASTETTLLLADLLLPEPDEPESPIDIAFDAPWPKAVLRPRIEYADVEVGARILAPALEAGDEPDDEYIAGYINREVGTAYDPSAYINPFSAGIEAANLGAVIPVNTPPLNPELEVWWYRRTASSAGANAGDGSRGFSQTWWPSVIGRYTLKWPANPRDIVMASKRGGENLSPLEAQGIIYIQNDPALDGYNPNEEHAIMQGGTPFATRDDLNITNGLDYSSMPYVLVSYTESDGRPAMTPFRVLREKPEAGYVFDYIVPAGQMLQPPPPLTFLQKPVEGTGDKAINYNTEPSGFSGDLPGQWNEANDRDGPYGHYAGFTYRDRKEEFWVYRGPHSGRPVMEAGTYSSQSDTFSAPGEATASATNPFRYTMHVSRQDQYLQMTSTNLPAWLSIDHLSLVGTPGAGLVGESESVTLRIEDRYDLSAVTQELVINIASPATPVSAQAPLVMVSQNPYTGETVNFTNRPPFLGVSPSITNSFVMQYYYKSQEGFAWPGYTTPPETGSIVPYLRPRDFVSGGYIGDAASKHTDSLKIVYRPVWPVVDPKDSSLPLPTLPYGATQTLPAYNLPGIRDWITAHVLYQQSIAADLTVADYSAVLHDPTVFKTADLVTNNLERLPAGVRQEPLRGRVYFPGLPPHLGKRLYFDPNRGEKGGLVLAGEFNKALLGENYILLNVLRGSDLQAAIDLCPEGPDYNEWVTMVNGLSVDVETFYEDPNQPGSYIPNSELTVAIGVSNVVEIWNDNIPRDSYALSATGPGSGYITMLESSGTAFTQPGDPVAMHVFKVGGPDLYRGELKILAAENPLSELVTFQHTADLAGRSDEFEYEWKIAAPVDGFPPEIDDEMTRYLALDSGNGLPLYTLGGAGIQALGDNYVVMRYRPKDPSHPLYNQWSRWTRPALAEGWIKRVLAGINPFNQRITDLFNNRVNTDVSLLTQAGQRWEGDVALNLDTINNYGLIEIYETVLRRGRSLSIESGFNYGPANDALLLAAGYLNDLYMILGNEAWADAANPTIGIGTANNTYGDIATALFSFRGQQASLLEEELALLRGRDDVFQPGVEIRPVYNRLIWNYTRGIDAGEVIYALNYNIQENPDAEPDGVINADDAARMFPQGHGDAYGHYLTAVKGYYSLLMNSNFDWVPRIEAVNVLGQPVSVDYQDERKFAAAAAALARAGQQVFDLTWRRDYDQVGKVGWQHFSDIRVNTQREYIAPGNVVKNPVRHWGLDQWASRVGQGTYVNWVVGNSMLPAEEPDPNKEGIQKVDRSTVPELKELPTIAQSLQTSLDNAEAGFSPLGVSETAIALDINPYIDGQWGQTHFEQIYGRAKVTLRNALVAFDDAKDVTRLMRSEQDSLAGLQNRVVEQELAFRNAMIELYGTPYPDDMGPGKTWKQDYDGPDTLHYMYVETPELPFAGLWNYPGEVTPTNWQVSLANLPEDWGANYFYTGTQILDEDQPVLEFPVGPHGYFEKPADWTGKRASPGKIQQAISAEIAAHARLLQTVYTQTATKASLDRLLGVFRAEIDTYDEIRESERALLIADEIVEKAQVANELFQLYQDSIKEDITATAKFAASGLPTSFLVGFSSGGDLTSLGRSALEIAGLATTRVLDKVKLIRNTVVKALETATSSARRWTEFDTIATLDRQRNQRAALVEIGNFVEGLQDQLWGINLRLREYDDAQRQVQSLLAEGERIQEEREIFRKRSSALVQGYRTRDAAFRIFRNEKLERYKTLFDLAARYALLSANAYDYETGLLGTEEGRSFIQRIVSARALGVVGPGGEPQFAGSNTGDPGLSSALAEMKADWDVLRGRLGFNNPDGYGTTVSLRTENFRILPGAKGDLRWREVLNRARHRDLLEDTDVRRFCMQISDGSGLPVPGLIIPFRTTITEGLNLFGQNLSAGDHSYNASAFATKIWAVGVALEGYQGMDDPSSDADASPTDPDLSFLDPDALAATPYVYLVPVGADSMRSPPLGDTSDIRTWMVEDIAVPMPFNIGDSDFSTAAVYQSNDSLTEPLFTTRKHQAFRPVSDAGMFTVDIYEDSAYRRSQFTNNRLVGRSVWNSQWKLVIPGNTLLSDDNEGLDRLIRTLNDVKIHFVTYSYSGN